MRALLVALALAVSVPAVVTMPACVSSGPVEYAPGPGTDYINASNTAKDLTVLLRAAFADGLIAADDWVSTVNPAIQNANAALDDWEAAVLSGRADEIGTARVVAEALIARLRDRLATAQTNGGA